MFDNGDAGRRKNRERGRSRTIFGEKVSYLRASIDVEG